jgi:tRNA-splicing ligase RtcB
MADWITPKVLSWASIIEEQARVQAIATGSMACVWPYLAVMPDIHYGRGCCVGVALPTAGAIIPAAVGTDQGCGMGSVRTQFTATDLPGKSLPELRRKIEAAIPLSAGNYNGFVDRITRPYVEELERLDGAKEATAISPNWHLQVKSLGSGNHFIEVSLDEEDRVWLFLHSGSRGVGNKLAAHFTNLAIAQCKGIALPNRDLAYLTEGTQEFSDYIRTNAWAQRFAYLNRQAMMDQVAACFGEWIGTRVHREESVNCHHNYTVPAEISGTPVWLSRKGAIDASQGVMGLIPGSMASASYVVSGKGNADALNTAPHGAGRRMSRGEAKRSLRESDITLAMKGIEWNAAKARVFLDESPQAYKPIGQVMRDAADLVSIQHTLRQILNVKGD